MTLEYEPLALEWQLVGRHSYRLQSEIKTSEFRVWAEACRLLDGEFQGRVRVDGIGSGDHASQAVHAKDEKDAKRQCSYLAGLFVAALGLGEGRMK